MTCTTDEIYRTSIYVHVQESWSYRLRHSGAVLANCRMMPRSVNLTERNTSIATLNTSATSGRVQAFDKALVAKCERMQLLLLI